MTIKFPIKIALATAALVAAFAVSVHPASAKIVTNSFVRIQRTIHTTNSKKQVRLTLPKKTTVQVARVKTIGGKKYVSINVERLSYQLRKPLLNAKSTSNYSRWIKATRTTFKQIKKPIYLFYYAAQSDGKRKGNTIKTENGNLWKGSRLPADYASQTDTRLRVTPDGYLEYYANSPFVYRTSPKPTASAKVRSATHPGSSGRDIMTFTTNISQLPFVKLANGRYQFTIQGTSYSTITAVPSVDNVKKILTAWISRIDQVDWFEQNSTTTLK